jgi:hypothetical protein
MTRLSRIFGLPLFFILAAIRPCFAAGLDAAPTDPFAYCSAVGDIDAPLAGASPIPAALIPYLMSGLRLPPGSEIAPERYYWRCMSGAVYVCATGANIPCDAKADRAKYSVGAQNYCRENRNAAFVPAYATGHATVYEWTCSAGTAVRGKSAARVDRRGYRADFWHRVSRK